MEFKGYVLITSKPQYVIIRARSCSGWIWELSDCDVNVIFPILLCTTVVSQNITCVCIQQAF